MCGPRCRVVGYGLNCGTRSFSGLCVGLEVWNTLKSIRNRTNNVLQLKLYAGIEWS